MQDLVVVLVMISPNALRSSGEGSLTQASFTALLKGAGFLLFVGFAMRYLLPQLFQMLSRPQELLVLFGALHGRSRRGSEAYLQSQQRSLGPTRASPGRTA